MWNWGVLEKETMRLAEGTEHWVRERAKVRRIFRFLSKNSMIFSRGKKKLKVIFSSSCHLTIQIKSKFLMTQNPEATKEKAK